MSCQSLMVSSLMTPVSWLPTVSSSIMGLFSKLGISPAAQAYSTGTILEIIPCPHEELFELPVFTISINPEYRVYAIIILLVCTGVLLQLNVYAATCIYYLVFSKSKNSSRVTSNRQKKFFYGILIQISVPYGFLIPAVIYSCYSIFNNYYNQTFNNLLVIFANFYGTVATFALLFTHSPYRDFIRRCCRLEKRKNTTTGKISISGNRPSVFVK
ncbi:CRE-SRH-76 protein [Caenorhabditis remanei]|uniref:CRE-SRH-76 protein n=1 Tax=Caenorhabditis remanei TaxID=31234 RepID=E3LUG8_CAERE|nr:CRE-SRH-76 protein [Caenorhabditis remanei]